MVAKASIIEIYARADAAGRVDIICKNYSNFIGIVDGYTEGLRYMIESEKAYNRKKNHGDLGVRVQTSGIHSDITADTAISAFYGAQRPPFCFRTAALRSQRPPIF